MSDKKSGVISLKRRNLCAGGLGLAALGPLGLAGCGGGDVSSSSDTPTRLFSMSSSAAAAARAFTHPGLLHTEADFTRMRARIAAGAQPWVNGWNALTTSGRAHLEAPPRPLVTVIRGGDGQNATQMYIDIARTYQLALRWKPIRPWRWRRSGWDGRARTGSGARSMRLIPTSTARSTICASITAP